MRSRRFPVVCALALSAVAAPLPPAAAAPAPPRAAPGGHESIRQHLADLTRSGAVGAQVRVTDGSRTWRARAGRARTQAPGPVPRRAAFRIGSATKMFTAVALLRLVGEGKVALDAPVSRYLSPRVVPDGDRITVRMALRHTSGLHDVARDLPQGERLVRTRFRHHDTERRVREAAARPADFPPGIRYGYSNTNYLVAALIIERVTGRPYGEEVRRAVIRPLGLRHTFVPGDRPDIPGPHAHGYLRHTAHGTARQADVTALNPSLAGAAGEIVSTADDLDALLAALADGRLLRPAEQREMRRTVPTGEPGTRYGLGLKQRKLSCGRTVLGHTGGIPGFATLAFTTPDGRHRVVLSANLDDWPADPRIGAPIDAVLDDAVCRPGA